MIENWNCLVISDRQLYISHVRQITFGGCGKLWIFWSRTVYFALRHCHWHESSHVFYALGVNTFRRKSLLLESWIQKSCTCKPRHFSTFPNRFRRPSHRWVISVFATSVDSWDSVLRQAHIKPRDNIIILEAGTDFSALTSVVTMSNGFNTDATSFNTTHSSADNAATGLCSTAIVASSGSCTSHKRFAMW